MSRHCQSQRNNKNHKEIQSAAAFLQQTLGEDTLDRSPAHGKEHIFWPENIENWHTGDSNQRTVTAPGYHVAHEEFSRQSNLSLYIQDWKKKEQQAGSLDEALQAMCSHSLGRNHVILTDVGGSLQRWDATRGKTERSRGPVVFKILKIFPKNISLFTILDTWIGGPLGRGAAQQVSGGSHFNLKPTL